MSARNLLIGGSPFAAIVFSLLISVQPAGAAEPAATTGDANLKSVPWWLKQAAEHCASIEDADARSDAYSKLAYQGGHAGELDSAAAWAMKVLRRPRRSMPSPSVAKKLHEQGNAGEATRLMEEARKSGPAARTKGGEFRKRTPGSGLHRTWDGN